MTRPVAISVGDPSGVGPWISLRAASRRPDVRFVLFGDAEQLVEIAAEEGIGCTVVTAAERTPDEGIALIDVGRCPVAERRLHAPSEAAGRVQLAALEAAARFVSSDGARALVTGPTSKEAISRTGAHFRGQTEHLAGLAELAPDAVTMLFLGPRLRTGLVTTHHAVRDVPDLITPERVARTSRHLAEALLRLGAESPELVVASLNPHAGEGGLFGDEEPRVIAVGIAAARREAPFVGGEAKLSGPIGAETAFRLAADGHVAGVVAMMHDQATIAAKLVDWGESVNVTWGLPFVRTSVDHGVAYDAAAHGEADARGMIAAIEMALRLTRE